MVADQAAKVGKFLGPLQEIRAEEKPNWITKWEVPYGVCGRVV